MRFEVLGALRVFDGEHEIEITRPAQRRLLLLLVQSFGETINGSQLVDRLWGLDPPRSAKDTLHVHLVGLRKVLGPSVIESLPTGYRLKTADVSVDAAEFTDSYLTCLVAIRADDWEEVLRIGDRTLAVWRGPPYPDLADNDHARPEIVLLKEQKVQLEEMRIRALLALGRNEETISVLESLVVQYPLRERVWQYLMLARYRVGRQAEALGAYQEIRRRLGEEMGVQPTIVLRELEERILLHDPTLGVESGLRSPNNLPVTHTSYVGRSADIDAVESMLRDHRVVTLTGGPGIGKTRTAVEVGRRMLDSHPAGTWYVEVGQGNPLRQIAANISMVVGLTESVESIPTLMETISHWRGLLIIDGAEHEPEAAHTLVESLLAGGGPLRMLVVTRSRAGTGSVSYRVTPMPYVPIGILSGKAVGYAAVQLFVDRARAVDWTFSVTEGNVDAVVDLCNKLGGIPLAIELAANWAGSLDASKLADILERVVPAVPLNAALDLSYRLLQPDARRAFLSLSIFPGSFSLVDAHAVCALGGDDELALSSTVARLVGASLVDTVRTEDGALMYRLLEPVKAYASAKLDAAEHETIADRHAEHFDGVCRELASNTGTLAERDAFGQLDSHLADLRLAWDRFFARGDHARVVRSVAGIDRYLFVRFLAWEGRDLLERALDEVDDPGTRAIGLCASGFLNYIEDDFPEAVSRLDKAAQLAHTVGDIATEAWSLTQLARVVTWTGEFETADAASATARALFIEVGNRRGAATAEFWSGVNRVNASVGVETRPLAAAIELLAQIGDSRLVSVGHRTLSDAALGVGNEEVARDRASRARESAELGGDTLATIGSRIQMALIESRWGDESAAARHLIEADALLTGSGAVDRMTVIGWPAVPVLMRSERTELAAEMLEMSDRVLTRHGGSIPPTSAVILNECRIALRGTIEMAADRQRTMDELVEEVRSALRGIVEAAP